MKYQPPRGTRDFDSSEMIKREFISDTIRLILEKYGYGTISTPGIESWDLLGKKGGGGEEIKKEVYVFKDKSGRDIGLRFEFTASFARFLANNPQLPKPFKRYQMGPVWRYDRPQAGRYREFLGCEIDIAGSSSPESDAEIISVTCEIFKTLGFKDFKIRLNNRKMLEGMINSIGVEKKQVVDVFRSIDKLDKIGVSGVEKELVNRGISKQLIPKILEFIGINGPPLSVLNKAQKFIKDPVGIQGVENIKSVIDNISGYDDNIIIDLSIVRGLEYYTGCVFEVAVSGGKLSVAGGGRYDNLVQLYGGQPTPCIGIGIGFERVFETMKANKMFKIPETNTLVFIVNVKPEFLKDSRSLADNLRSLGIPTETELMSRPLRKQLDYVNSKSIPFALFVGEKELKTKKFTLRDMKSGKELSLDIKGIQTMLQKS